MTGLVDKDYCRKHNFNFHLDKEDLSNSYDEFLFCWEWLSQCAKNIRKSSSSPSSYDLKYLVEKNHNTYIPNGALIAAALFSEVPYQNVPGSPNIQVGISKSCPFYKAEKDKYYL